MKKILGILLSIMMVLSLTTGCDKKDSKNNEENKELAIEDIHDYYINYFNGLVIESYKDSYAAYLLQNSFGTKEDFKNNYFERKEQIYSFYDINSDGIDEFILVTKHKKDEYYFQDYKYIDIYTLNSDTKEVTNFLSSLYFDNLFYNATKDIYLTRTTNDDETGGAYVIITYSEKDKMYERKEELNYNLEANKYYKIGDNDGKILTKDDIENSAISKEEYLSYVSNLKEIKFELYDIDNIYDDYIDDEILNQIENQIKGYYQDENLKCTKQDVDNIVNLLLSGTSVYINKDSDIKFSSNEAMQYYNETYPYATVYNISCGSYSRTVRISHK